MAEVNARMGSYWTGYSSPYDEHDVNWIFNDAKFKDGQIYLKFNDGLYHVITACYIGNENTAIEFFFISKSSQYRPVTNPRGQYYRNGILTGTGILNQYGYYAESVDGWYMGRIGGTSSAGSIDSIAAGNTQYGAPHNTTPLNIIGKFAYTASQRPSLIRTMIAMQDDIPEYGFEWDTSSKAGGEGADYDDNYTDDIELVSETDLNANSLSSTKFVTTYMLSIPQMNDLGNKLWSIISALGNSVLKPQDFIISCCMIPYTSTGSQKLIKAGWLLLDGAMGSVIANQYVRVPCGTLSLPEKWGSAIDYQTQLSIVLPFIGERALSAQEFIGGQIKVDYTIDLITGACVAAISAIRGDLDSVLYQFTGNCASQIPITSQDFSRLLGGIGLTAQSGSGTMNGNSTATITSKTGERTKESEVDNRTQSSQSSRNSGVNSNLNFSAFAPQCNKTGDLSRTVGFMTIRKPYLIIRRPIQCLAENFKKYKGYVSNITAKLSDLQGYTEVGFCNLSVPSATSQELMEIRALLTSGVII